MASPAQMPTHAESFDIDAEDPFPAVSEIMHRAVAERIFPGGVVTFGRLGSSVPYYARGYGTFTFESRIPTTPDSVWDVASLTKVLATTPAVMLLYEEGRIELDAPAAKYVPEFGQNGKGKITIRQLMTHTAGLREWYNFYSMGLRSHDEIVSFIYSDKAWYPVGSRSRYSDLSMIVVAKVVERIAGMSLDRFVADRLYTPMGMSRTGFRRVESLRWDPDVVPTEVERSFRHRLLWGEVHDANAYLMGGVAGHAGLFSSASDISRFARMLLAGGVDPVNGVRVFRHATVRLFSTPVNFRAMRSLGWDCKARSGSNSSAGRRMGRRSYGHTGFTGTSLWLDPQRQVFVCVLANAVHPTADSLEGAHIVEVRPAVADAAVEHLVGPPIVRLTPRKMRRMESSLRQRMVSESSLLAAASVSVSDRHGGGGVTQQYIGGGEARSSCGRAALERGPVPRHLSGRPAKGPVSPRGLEPPAGTAWSTPGGFEEYTLAPGEHVWRVAADRGVTLDEVRRVNPEVCMDVVQAGQVIRLPKAGLPSASPAAAAAPASNTPRPPTPLPPMSQRSTTSTADAGGGAGQQQETESRDEGAGVGSKAGPDGQVAARVAGRGGGGRLGADGGEDNPGGPAEPAVAGEADDASTARDPLSSGDAVATEGGALPHPDHAADGDHGGAGSSAGGWGPESATPAQGGGDQGASGARRVLFHAGGEQPDAPVSVPHPPPDGAGSDGGGNDGGGEGGPTTGTGRSSDSPGGGGIEGNDGGGVDGGEGGASGQGGVLSSPFSPPSSSTVGTPEPGEGTGTPMSRARGGVDVAASPISPRLSSSRTQSSTNGGGRGAARGGASVYANPIYNDLAHTTPDSGIGGGVAGSPYGSPGFGLASWALLHAAGHPATLLMPGLGVVVGDGALFFANALFDRDDLSSAASASASPLLYSPWRGEGLGQPPLVAAMSLTPPQRKPGGGGGRVNTPTTPASYSPSLALASYLSEGADGPADGGGGVGTPWWRAVARRASLDGGSPPPGMLLQPQQQHGQDDTAAAYASTAASQAGGRGDAHEAEAEAELPPAVAAPPSPEWPVQGEGDASAAAVRSFPILVAVSASTPPPATPPTHQQSRRGGRGAPDTPASGGGAAPGVAADGRDGGAPRMRRRRGIAKALDVAVLSAVVVWGARG